jgi:predicted secreted protein
MRFDETANGNEVRLHVGEALEIVLAETRTTGYQWLVVESGAPVCRVVRDAFQAGDPAPGAPGMHTWVVAVEREGTATFALAYQRSFGSGEAARRFTLRIVAE